MVEGRATLGLRRQISFARAGGFDNHQNQLVDQGNGFNEVGPALRAFYNTIVALGVQDQVTPLTLFDFGRTLRVNDGGSDHAWGNHHIVIGELPVDRVGPRRARTTAHHATPSTGSRAAISTACQRTHGAASTATRIRACAVRSTC